MTAPATPPLESDAQLAARFACEAMQYHQVLLRSARRLTHCEADAEDLVQDTLMHAYMGFRRFEAGTNLRAWLFRILHNRWISAYRRKQRRPNELTVDEITDSDMAGSAMHSSNAGRSAEEEALDVLPDRQIREALGALPEGFRQVVFYADVQGYTYAETASLMGIPMGTVMSRISRSRDRLRTSLGATEPDAA